MSVHRLVERSLGRLRREHGFTLVELLISMTLMLVLMFATFDSLDGFSANARENERRADASQQARAASDQLARELRNLASPGVNSPAIEVADRSNLVFKAVDPIGPNAGLNSANLARVRYCLDAADAKGQRRLWKQWQTWTTTTPPAVPTSTSCPALPTVGTYAGVASPVGWSGSARLADSLVNRGNGTNRAFRYDTTTLSDIASIKFKMAVDPNPETNVFDPTTGTTGFGYTGQTDIDTGVALRNQNRAPTASFSALALGSRQVILNGSASVEPDGQPMQYQWYVNGSLTPLTDTSPIVQYTAPGAGTYTFTLKVTDPAGLFNQAAVQTVTIS